MEADNYQTNISSHIFAAFLLLEKVKSWYLVHSLCFLAYTGCLYACWAGILMSEKNKIKRAAISSWLLGSSLHLASKIF